VCYDVISRTGSGYPLGELLPSSARPPFFQKVFLCFGWEVLGFDEEGLIWFLGLVLSPVGLHEDGVDLFEVDGFGLVAHGFDEGSDAEVFDAA